MYIVDRNDVRFGTITRMLTVPEYTQKYLTFFTTSGEIFTPDAVEERDAIHIFLKGMDDVYIVRKANSSFYLYLLSGNGDLSRDQQGGLSLTEPVFKQGDLSYRLWRSIVGYVCREYGEEYSEDFLFNTLALKRARMG